MDQRENGPGRSGERAGPRGRHHQTSTLRGDKATPFRQISGHAAAGWGQLLCVSMTKATAADPGGTSVKSNNAGLTFLPYLSFPPLGYAQQCQDLSILYDDDIQ